MNPSIDPDEPNTWPKLKITCSGLKYLQNEFQMNMLAGENVNFDSPEKLSGIFFAATRSWEDAPTMEEISDRFGIREITEAITSMMNVVKESPEEQKKIGPSTTSGPGSDSEPELQVVNSTD